MTNNDSVISQTTVLAYALCRIKRHWHTVLCFCAHKSLLQMRRNSNIRLQPDPIRPWPDPIQPWPDPIQPWPDLRLFYCLALDQPIPLLAARMASSSSSNGPPTLSPSSSYQYQPSINSVPLQQASVKKSMRIMTNKGAR